MEAVAIDSIGIEFDSDFAQARRFHRATVEFERIRFAAAGRDQLLADVAAALLRLSTAGVVMRVALDSNQPVRCPELLSGAENRSSGAQFHAAEPVDQLEIRILASRYPSLPTHIEQWGASMGIKSITARQTCVDSATDVDRQILRLISIPILLTSSNQESLSALFVGASADGLPEISLLQSAVYAIERWDANQQTIRLEQLARDAAALNEIASHIKHFQTLQACCQQIANRLHEYITGLQNQQGQPADDELEILVALVDSNAQPQLTAISNTHSLPDNSPLRESVEAAIGECLCRQGNAVWPPELHDRHALLCHRRLAEQHSRPHLITVPLHCGDGKLQAAVMFASQSALTTRTRRFCHSLTETLSSTLMLVKRAEQNRWQRFLTNTCQTMRTRKARVAIVLAGIVFLFGLIPLPYRIIADCEVQPAIRRFVCSPFDTQLKDCLIEPGDFVAANDILAQLDEREVRMELSEIEAAFHRASRELDGHVAAHESGEARLAQLETEKLQARQQLLIHRINNLELRSPIAGMVISGDLKKAAGMPLETGQTLFEIAPLQHLVIELLVPEDDIRFLKSGLDVRLRLDAFPFESWQGIVDRIHPAAEIRNDNNVFVATVRLDNPAGRLRPGMQGSAKISSLWRPISWNILHKPVASCMRWLGW